MKTLNAKEGMYLTQLYEVQNKIFVKSITGASATYLNWKDATLEEKKEYEKNKLINSKVFIEKKY